MRNQAAESSLDEHRTVVILDSTIIEMLRRGGLTAGWRAVQVVQRVVQAEWRVVVFEPHKIPRMS